MTDNEESDTRIRFGLHPTCDCGWSGHESDMIDVGDGWTCPSCGRWLIGRGDTLYG